MICQVERETRYQIIYYTELDHTHTKSLSAIIYSVYNTYLPLVTLRTASFLPSELPLDYAIFTLKNGNIP